MEPCQAPRCKQEATTNYLTHWLCDKHVTVAMSEGHSGTRLRNQLGIAPMETLGVVTSPTRMTITNNEPGMPTEASEQATENSGTDTPAPQEETVATKTKTRKSKKIVSAREARPSTNGLKTFAVRIPPDLSMKFHKAAGPARGSKVCIALMEAFAEGGTAADFTRALKAIEKAERA